MTCLLYKKPPFIGGFLIKIGVAGFEPATSWSQTRRASQTTLHPDVLKTYKLSREDINAPPTRRGAIYNRSSINN